MKCTQYYNSFDEGMEDHKRLFAKLREQGFITYKDFMKIVDKTEGSEFLLNPQFDGYGWFDLNELKVEFDDVNNSWYLQTPDMVKLSVKKTGEDQNYNSDDEMVSHPSHYISNKGIETINVIEAFTDGLNGIEAVDTAQVIKYICRWKNKNGLQDLEKAMWYLTHLINHVKEKENK